MDVVLGDGFPNQPKMQEPGKQERNGKNQLLIVESKLDCTPHTGNHCKNNAKKGYCRAFQREGTIVRRLGPRRNEGGASNQQMTAHPLSPP